MPRALFVLHRAPDLNTLLPFVGRMQHGSGWELAVTAAPYDAAAHIGLPDLHRARLRKLGVDVVESAAEWRPDVTVCMDPVEGELETGGKLVRLPASLICKGQRFTDRPPSHLDNLADLHLVPGAWHADRMRGTVFSPVETVGFPSLDPLLGGWLPSREEYMTLLRLDPRKRLILYAPTWNPELSSLPILWTRIAALADENTYLLLRPHPYASPEAMDAYTRLEDRTPHVFLAGEADVQPYLFMADLLVTDVSSVAYEFAALDKPVVLFDSPNQAEYPEYDPRDAEYVLRGIGPSVTNLEELKQAVSESLANPRNHAAQRAGAAERLLAFRDGHATDRVLSILNDLASGQAAVGQTAREPVTAILDARPGEEEACGKTLEELLECGGEDVRVTLVDHGLHADRVQGWRNRWPRRLDITVPGEADTHQASPAGTSYVVFVRAGVTGERKWLSRLLNHLRRAPEMQAVAPLALGGGPSQDPSVRLGFDLERGVEGKTVDRAVSVEHAGQRLEPILPPHNDLWAVRASHPRTNELLRRALNGDPSGPETVQPTVVAMDVCVEFPGWREPSLAGETAPVPPELRPAVEKRVAELAAWIGRIVPPALRITSGTAAPRPAVQPAAAPANSAVRPKNRKNGANGRLRLALHYEARGKREEAVEHLRAAWRMAPGDADTLAAARRLGVELEAV